jgi:hypothetical protein
MEDDNDPPCVATLSTNSEVTIMHYRSKPRPPAKEMPFRTLKLTSALLRPQPIHRLSCEPIEGLHRQLQIVDLRIFCLVVTKPGE